MIHILDSGRKKERKKGRTRRRMRTREENRRESWKEDDDENDNLECLPFFPSLPFYIYLSLKDVICFLSSPMLIKMNIYISFH